MSLKSVFLLIILFSSISFRAHSSAPDSAQAVVLVRCDDLGMCHAVNMAAKHVFESGIPVSVSVMFACPWYQEAIDLLRQHPDVSVGVHLTLNAEWKNYRWGPVAGKSAVPSLVDSVGFFFPSRASFFGNKPRLDEIEKELRAQIVRAVRSGVRIDYLDYHMGTAVDKPELRSLVESLAKEYGLAISRYFDEVDVSGVYGAPPASKLDTLLSKTKVLSTPRINLVVFHIGLQSAEMDALLDMNSFGPTEMSKHREAELKALLSPQFRELLTSKHIQLTTYRDLVNQRGLKSMKRPVQME